MWYSKLALTAEPVSRAQSHLVADRVKLIMTVIKTRTLITENVRLIYKPLTENHS